MYNIFKPQYHRIFDWPTWESLLYIYVGIMMIKTLK